MLGYSSQRQIHKVRGLDKDCPSATRQLTIQPLSKWVQGGAGSRKTDSVHREAVFEVTKASVPTSVQPPLSKVELKKIDVK